LEKKELTDRLRNLPEGGVSYARRGTPCFRALGELEGKGGGDEKSIKMVGNFSWRERGVKQEKMVRL